MAGKFVRTASAKEISSPKVVKLGPVFQGIVLHDESPPIKKRGWKSFDDRPAPATTVDSTVAPSAASKVPTSDGEKLQSPIVKALKKKSVDPAGIPAARNALKAFVAATATEGGGRREARGVAVAESHGESGEDTDGEGEAEDDAESAWADCNEDLRPVAASKPTVQRGRQALSEASLASSGATPPQIPVSPGLSTMPGLSNPLPSQSPLPWPSPLSCPSPPLASLSSPQPNLTPPQPSLSPALPSLSPTLPSLPPLPSSRSVSSLPSTSPKTSTHSRLPSRSSSFSESFFFSPASVTLPVEVPPSSDGSIPAAVSRPSQPKLQLLPLRQTAAAAPVEPLVAETCTEAASSASESPENGFADAQTVVEEPGSSKVIVARPRRTPEKVAGSIRNGDDSDSLSDLSSSLSDEETQVPVRRRPRSLMRRRPSAALRPPGIVVTANVTASPVKDVTRQVSEGSPATRKVVETPQLPSKVPVISSESVSGDAARAGDGFDDRDACLVSSASVIVRTTAAPVTLSEALLTDSSSSIAREEPLLKEVDRPAELARVNAPSEPLGVNLRAEGDAGELVAFKEPERASNEVLPAVVPLPSERFPDMPPALSHSVMPALSVAATPSAVETAAESLHVAERDKRVSGGTEVSVAAMMWQDGVMGTLGAMVVTAVVAILSVFAAALEVFGVGLLHLRELSDSHRARWLGSGVVLFATLACTLWHLYETLERQVACLVERAVKLKSSPAALMPNTTRSSEATPATLSNPTCTCHTRPDTSEPSPARLDASSQITTIREPVVVAAFAASPPRADDLTPRKSSPLLPPIDRRVKVVLPRDGKGGGVGVSSGQARNRWQAAARATISGRSYSTSRGTGASPDCGTDVDGSSAEKTGRNTGQSSPPFGGLPTDRRAKVGLPRDGRGGGVGVSGGQARNRWQAAARATISSRSDSKSRGTGASPNCAIDDDGSSAEKAARFTGNFSSASAGPPIVLSSSPPAPMKTSSLVSSSASGQSPRRGGGSQSPKEASGEGELLADKRSESQVEACNRWLAARQSIQSKLAKKELGGGEAGATTTAGKPVSDLWTSTLNALLGDTFKVSTAPSVEEAVAASTAGPADGAFGGDKPDEELDWSTFWDDVDDPVREASTSRIGRSSSRRLEEDSSSPALPSHGRRASLEEVFSPEASARSQSPLRPRGRALRSAQKPDAETPSERSRRGRSSSRSRFAEGLADLAAGFDMGGSGRSLATSLRVGAEEDSIPSVFSRSSSRRAASEDDAVSQPSSQTSSRRNSVNCDVGSFLLDNDWSQLVEKMAGDGGNRASSYGNGEGYGRGGVGGISSNSKKKEANGVRGLGHSTSFNTNDPSSPPCAERQMFPRSFSASSAGRVTTGTSESPVSSPPSGQGGSPPNAGFTWALQSRSDEGGRPLVITEDRSTVRPETDIASSFDRDQLDGSASRVSAPLKQYSLDHYMDLKITTPGPDDPTGRQQGPASNAPAGGQPIDEDKVREDESRATRERCTSRDGASLPSQMSLPSHSRSPHRTPERAREHGCVGDSRESSPGQMFVHVDPDGSTTSWQDQSIMSRKLPRGRSMKT